MSYFTWTGNPWVDAGVSALCSISNRSEPESIALEDARAGASQVLALYPQWASKGSGFVKVFHNFAPFNPSVPYPEDLKIQIDEMKRTYLSKNQSTKKLSHDKQYKEQRKALLKQFRTPTYVESIYKERYGKFLDELLGDLTVLSSAGTCISCGKGNSKYLLQRDKHPLLGSGDLLNYFSFFDNGLGFCANCTFAIQFLPLSIVQIGKWLCLVHSAEPKIMLAKRKGIAHAAIEHFHRLAAAKRNISFYDPNIKANSLAEAIVRLAVDLTEDSDILGLEKVAIRLYRFSNAGQTANVSFVDLPAPVFRFIARTKQRGLKSELEQLLRYGGFDIFQRLTDNQSVRYFFFDRENKLIRGGWKLFELYLKEVDEMDQDNLGTLISVADKLHDYLRKTNSKALKEIEQASYTEFRRVLLSIQKVFPICTAEQLPVILSFDGWNETRDMILFRIYERQHILSASSMESQVDDPRDRLRARLPLELEKRLSIADRLFDYCIMQNHKNRLQEIEQANKYSEFRKALLAIQRDMLVCNAEQLPLLFPKDESGRVYWDDVRDTLLFRIYELNHQTFSKTT